jgi:hypothetical protein
MTNQRLKLRIWSVLGLSALLVACVEPPPRRTVVMAQPVPPPSPIMVYPAQGQTPSSSSVTVTSVTSGQCNRPASIRARPA